MTGSYFSLKRDFVHGWRFRRRCIKSSRTGIGEVRDLNLTIPFLLQILHRENGSDHLSDGAADGEEIDDTLLSPTAEGVQWSRPETAEIGIEEDGNERDVPWRGVSNATGKPPLGAWTSQWLPRADHCQFLFCERFCPCSSGRGRTLESVSGPAKRYGSLDINTLSVALASFHAEVFASRQSAKYGDQRHRTQGPNRPVNTWTTNFIASCTTRSSYLIYMSLLRSLGRDSLFNCTA